MTESTVQEAVFPNTGIPEIKNPVKFQPNWGWSFAICFLILALRNELHEVFFPLLYGEDGREIFNRLYNDHNFSNIFYFYGGYIRVFPNLVGYLLHFFPIQLIPSLYAIVSLMFTAFVYSLFYRVIDHVFDNRWFAFYAALLIIALPQANFELVGTLMFQIWHAAIALFVLTFLPLPEKNWVRMLYLLFMHILIWTHPFSFLVLPFYIYRVIRNSEHRFENGIFVLSILSYFMFAVLRGPLYLDALPIYHYILMSRVGTEGVVGPYNLGWLNYIGLSLPFGFIVFLLMGVIIWFSRMKLNTREKWFLILLGYFILVPLAASMLGRDLNDYYHLLRGGPRYTYISRLAFLMMGLSALFLLYQRSKFFRKAHWVLAALVLIINTNANVLYKTDLKVGQSVRDYVAYVDQNQLDCVPGEERWFILHRGNSPHPGTPGGWSILANLCKH